MKNANVILATILLVVAGCVDNRQTMDDLITVDVVANHPERELILQDIMDVEYIPLETNENFLTQGEVLAVGNEIVLLTNRNNDGDIFIFDRKTGKGLRKINRKGQGAEEYLYINEIVLDESKQEMFVINAPKIQVYDLYGNFRRILNIPDGSFYSDVYNYDRDNLICYKQFVSLENLLNNHSCHLVISKEDGSITQEIRISVENIKKPVVIAGEASAASSLPQIIPYQKNWLLVETSSDTVYRFVPDANELIPFAVRTPSIQTMGAPEVFLTMSVLTDHYCFMRILKAEFDFTTGRGFPVSALMYDRQNKSLFKPSVYNGDYSGKIRVGITLKPLNDKITSSQILEAPHLVEYYKNDKLKGKLKEIASTLNEESNPVIMLTKYKK